MRKVFMLLLLAALTLSSGIANAEIRAHSFSVYPFVGGYLFEGNEGLKESYLVGIRGGYNLTERIGVEGFFHYVPAEIKDMSGDNDVDLYGYGAEGLYYFMPSGKLVPFVAAGLGGIHYRGPAGLDETNKFALDYGAGLKFFVTDSIALRADVRHVIPFNDRYNDLLVALGVNFDFGGNRRETAQYEQVSSSKSVGDADRDGVPDDVDRCSDTPYGLAVDKDGCSLDTDFDGVPDTFDKCPGTVYGVIVDKDGCVPDGDKDGVPDSIDKCPSTPEGVIVDKDGCTADSDNDGVADYLDKCSGTPAGMVVDKDGCPVVKEEVKKEVKTPEKITMTLKIEFDTAKAVIKKKYHKEIKKVADFLKEHPEAKAVIEGHTDNVDKFHNPENNIKLSQARAESVRQYLMDHFGIDPSRITAVGYGPNRPIASNDTASGRKKNRRVEAVIESLP
ncbi:MAG TPA: OmpA family protein [Smithella sp.]|nr:OmpA family protein [Smithella sp.]